MKIVKEIFARVWALWGFTILIVSMLVCFIFMMPCFFLKDPQRAALQRNVSKVWMGIFLTCSLVFVKAKNKSVFQKGKSYIITGNHNSFMDVFATNPFVPHVAKTIAKAELARFPIFGSIYSWGSVLVDRSSAQSRQRSYLEMKETLALGMDMLLFPEGTRNKSDKPLGKFQSGAFKLAVDTQKEIIPMVIFNTRKILPADKKFYLLPGIIKIRYLPPISPEGKSVEELQKQVFETMWNYYSNNND
jgi:1-acyl-sn-glycerol-3-phosphate acyltransferase